MKYQTVVDTVCLQIDLTQIESRDAMLEDVLGIFRRENLYISIKDYPTNLHSDFYVREYQACANNVVVASIRAGSFPIKNHVTNTVITTYYISLEFAGLVTYNIERDKIIDNILMTTCAYFNSRNITFKLTGLDISLDLLTKFENVLALCTKKSPKTVYHGANEVQFYDTTSYIEKIEKYKRHLAVQSACLYDKAFKELLPYDLVRHEVKLQPKFFNKNRENLFPSIMSALDRYHVMYVPNKKVKQYLMDEYDNHPILRQRDIKKLKFDSYRCYPDISVVVGFVNALFTVQESDLFRNIND